jgi:mannose-6-phosphate isomerase-like protein (cupin superfamily)
VYILSGSVRFQWGRERFLLEAGDSITYDATVPHLSENAGRRREAVLLAVSAEASSAQRLGIGRLL